MPFQQALYEDGTTRIRSHPVDPPLALPLQGLLTCCSKRVPNCLGYFPFLLIFSSSSSFFFFFSFPTELDVRLMESFRTEMREWGVEWVAGAQAQEVQLVRLPAVFSLPAQTRAASEHPGQRGVSPSLIDDFIKTQLDLLRTTGVSRKKKRRRRRSRGGGRKNNHRGI